MLFVIIIFAIGLFTASLGIILFKKIIEGINDIILYNDYHFIFIFFKCFE